MTDLKIGIAVLTRNRKNELRVVLDHIEQHTKTLYDLAISMDRCEDGTRDYLQDRYGYVNQGLATFIDPPEPGIAASRNAIFHHFRDYTHVFVFEDDFYPIKDEWEKPYLLALDEKTPALFALSQEQHGDVLNTKPYLCVQDGTSYIGKVLYRTHLTTQMVAIHTSLLDTLGYFNPGYGTRYGLEDSEWGSRGRDSGLFGSQVGFPCLEQEGVFQHITDPSSSDSKSYEDRMNDIDSNSLLFQSYPQRSTFLPYPYKE